MNEKKEQQPATVQYAVLDAMGLLIGYCATPADIPADGADTVEVPLPCDLEPGKYFHDKGEFKPVRNGGMGGHGAEAMPSVSVAIAMGFEAIRDSGKVKLPTETLKWLAWWRKTMDSVGVNRG